MDAIGRNKRCCKCKVWKSISEFHKNKSAADGYSHDCKSCKSSYDAAYRAANKESLSAKGKAYRSANKDKLNARSSAYYAANKEKLKGKYAAYRSANRDRIAAYRAASKERMAAHNISNNAKEKFALDKLRELGMDI